MLATLVWFFAGVGGLAAKAIGGKTQGDSIREQFQATVQMAGQTSGIAAFNQRQVRRVLQFAQMTAAGAMYPLADVSCLSSKAGIEELVALRRKQGLRLVPLYQNNVTNITGVAVIESWKLLDPNINKRSVDEFLGEVESIPSIQRMSEVIETLEANPRKNIVVVNELGDSLGLITINLIVSRTLGAETSPLTGRSNPDRVRAIKQQNNGSYLIDARYPIVSVNEHLNVNLSTLNQHTIGGWALSNIGHLPKGGESCMVEGYQFTKRMNGPS